MSRHQPDLELIELLRTIGWQSDQLAARLGNARSTIADWLSGRRATDQRIKPWLRLVAAGMATAPPVPEGWEPRRAGRPPSIRPDVPC